MKMNFPLQNNRKGKKHLMPFLVIGVVIFVVVCFTVFSPLFFPKMSQGIGRPLWVSGNFIMEHTSAIRGFFLSRIKLVEKNKALEQELVDIRIKLLAQSVVEQENKEFKQSWGRNTNISAILSAVLVRPPHSAYDTFILDVGLDSAVTIGNMVFASDTVVLGVIDQVFEKTSRAKLFSSVDTHTDALVDRNSLSVELVGTGGGNFEIRVPQDVDVIEGDKIILPGIVPHILAIVEAIESVPTDSFKRIFCKTPVHIGELRLVSILK